MGRSFFLLYLYEKNGTFLSCKYKKRRRKHETDKRTDTQEQLKLGSRLVVTSSELRSNYELSFGFSRIRINPYVLGWIGVEPKLNSTLIHSNTCGLK